MMGWNEAKDQAVEVMLEAVHSNNEYGQWASQLFDGWGDDDDLRRLFANLLTALLEARQSEPCAACGGDGLDGSHAAAIYYADRGELTACDDCDGSGRVPGTPLVLLAPEQVGWHCTVEDPGLLPNERPATWLGELRGHYRNDISREPLYAAQTEEKQT